ncbi:MAG TPA: alpha/beta hydrolase [Burkholderiales bacterium]|nr:alpha/beta hydrolase [Burkholderiales bacterium]
MFADLPTARLWYEDSGGAGPVVMLLHAGTGSSPGWREQIRAFSAAGFRVLAYDRCGHGRSEGSGCGVASQDLHALVDLLSIRNLSLVGTAAGAIVALDFSLTHPERVTRLVLANTHLSVQEEDYVALQKRLRPAPHFDTLPPDLKELGPSYRAANPEGVKHWLALEQASRQKGAPTLPKTANRITFAALGTLPMPTLLLTGDADLYMPPSVLRLLAARMPHATTQVVPECGHSAYWEQPAVFNTAVLDFLRNRGQNQ